MTRWQTCATLALLALLFVAAGLLFIPRMGIEADEALVANGIYPHGQAWYSWHFGQDEVPVMLISYLGALKTWMYNGIFLLTPPRPLSLRLPTLLLAAATLPIFFSLLRRTISRRAAQSAWIATVLLATDSSYLLMNTIDYGPVTFHFLFKLAAMLLLVKFWQDGGRGRTLEAASFLIGLALWDKAIFGWSLIGVGGAALILFHREILPLATVRNLARAALATALGALPLLIYNMDRPLETLRGNATVEQLAVLGKGVILTRALDGSVLFGFMTAGDFPPSMPPIDRWYQQLSVQISTLLGNPHTNLTLWALGATVLALPFLWRTPARTPILFGLLAGVGTWIPMILTGGAGAAAQHVLLVWPFQFLAIGAALTQIPWKAGAAITALLCASNLAVTNEYYTELVAFGPSVRWTDASDALHQFLTDLPPQDPDAPPGRPQIWIADWGIMETMNLLGEGSLDIYVADDAGGDGTRSTFDNPNSVFVAHHDGLAIQPEHREALRDFAARENYIEEPITTIYDRYGRPTFDVFRFRKP